MTTDAFKQHVRQMTDDTLDLFRAKLAEAGPKGRCDPLLRVLIEPSSEPGSHRDTEATMPWGQPWTHSGLDHLVMHLFLDAVGAKAYAIAMEVRAGGAAPQTGAYACGGTAGWDTAIGEVYGFVDGQLEIKSRVTGDSDRPRIAALSTVPNLLQPLQTTALSADQQSALKDYVDILVAQLRRQIGP
ncbi:hypothetical protein [Hydrocarboniphaga effusa]|uniref:Uncharacterized protein n=1 Tax=Hydrocarboniphaga effusa AP103 TaxID=1172194 RepID=I8T3L7_9GAMM|nr:hypothetical protein [Hydrocarboniphaga effusa]EIT68308.1 hypothetical protein WQQ_35030 [Hydrocarboniphaga effusa AP103]